MGILVSLFDHILRYYILIAVRENERKEGSTAVKEGVKEMVFKETRG